jgi:tRNA dimethylallyltransferase
MLLRNGWIEEVEALLDSGVPPGCRAMQSLGYREIAASLRGRLPRSDLAGAITLQTRRYAKRQLTWFRALPVQWLSAEPAGTLAERALAALEPLLDEDDGSECSRPSHLR